MTANKIAGALLLLGPLIPVAGSLLLVLAWGYRPVIGASQADLERIAGQITPHRWALGFWVAGFFTILMGFGVLTTLLEEPTAQRVSWLALIGFVVTFILVALEATFHMSVTTWTAAETVRSATVPRFYEPLRQWVDYGQFFYTMIGLLSIAGFGWAFLQTELVPVWLGWACVAWSALWLVAFIALRATIPGFLLIMPLVIGIAMLVKDKV
jgi:hypothetical protein